MMPPVATSAPDFIISSIRAPICAMCSAEGGPLGAVAGVNRLRNCMRGLLEQANRPTGPLKDARPRRVPTRFRQILRDELRPEGSESSADDRELPCIDRPAAGGLKRIRHLCGRGNY